MASAEDMTQRQRVVVTPPLPLLIAVVATFISRAAPYPPSFAGTAAPLRPVQHAKDP